ncbi:MAG: DUF4397 domain-containing protein, partial [Gemmatimonadaceae bacterium]
MRRILQLSTLCIAAGVASACKPADVETVAAVPTSGVRFINAVPDTAGAAGLDFRFVDLVENSNDFRVTFRNNPQSSGGVTASSAIQYKAAQAGSRHFRIFLDDTIQTIASTVLKDTTVNFTAGHNYTVLLQGNARGGGLRLNVIDEAVPDPAAQVALRVMNTTGAPVDARQYVSTGSAPASATWSSVPAYGVSTYVTVAPSQIKFNIQPAGGGTALFADALALIGQPIGTQTGGCTVGVDCDVIPGTTVPGSAITLIVFPPSVAGSRASSFTT